MYHAGQMWDSGLVCLPYFVSPLVHIRGFVVCFMCVSAVHVGCDTAALDTGPVPVWFAGGKWKAFRWDP